MTKDEIMQLEGRGLDVAVAERVTLLDFSEIPSRKDFHYEGNSMVPTPSYSSDMSSAFKIIEKMMKLGYRYVLRGNFEGNGLHWCGFDQQEWADLNPLWQCKPCKSLPVAICRSALLAMEDSDGMD